MFRLPEDWTSMPRLIDSKHLCACGRSRRPIAQYSETSSAGTAEPTQFNTNLAMEISQLALSTCMAQAWTHVCMLYPPESWTGSTKAWSRSNIITLLKLNSFLIIVANHSGLSSLPAARSWNQRSWLSKYAQSWSNFSADLFRFCMWRRDRFHVVHKVWSSYDSNFGAVCWSSSQDDS